MLSGQCRNRSGINLNGTSLTAVTIFRYSVKDALLPSGVAVEYSGNFLAKEKSAAQRQTWHPVNHQNRAHFKSKRCVLGHNLLCHSFEKLRSSKIVDIRAAKNVGI